MSCAPFIIWKEEPLSPLSNEEVSWLSDDTFYQTSTEHEHIKFEDDLVPCESKAEVASLMLENLENLINLDELIKEEPSFLLDEKILPNILDDVDQARAILPPPPTKLEYVPNTDTQFLLKEFENVYDVVELTHETLTPPQSPPHDYKILTTLEPLLQLPVVPEKLAYPTAMTPQPDIAHELAVVDELVRTRVEDMQWSSGPSSPNSSDCSSDDPEWMPEPVESYDGSASSPKQARKRAKPYSRTSPVDKKSRKKEQNKNAATRYRMKKKAEVEVILSEEKQLSMKNEELDAKINDLQREIKYLKGLMRDLFKAKGLIN
ncbi:activating transcription factor of chaperone [Tribolium castaneum]|uniref:ATF4 n=1 Tax=Tribolium castaneum TaxID=7070 RepID=D6WDB8_TRICA|nr:activating transcription factor of chaperone [Tribolium castaneum]AHX26752.1 ATF4 [Tribolium castaneum]AHX26757.1 ATF4 [Tribolium castaneum]EEZ99481.1 Activating transcription factor of chaperone-like Protein [Tribolium castaneum]|eukprot:NP_001280506.1 activating transcription factor of chaperone [Tribolium castaneum]